MSEEKKEVFLDRWSRLKQKSADEAAAPPPAERKEEPPAAAAPLPPVEDLTPESDFKPFMDPRVATETRRDALKKLFTDPHFSTVDPFEPYSVDLTGEDPIPEQMLKSLNHARRLLFDEAEKTAEAAAETPTQEGQPKPDDVARKQDA